MKDYKLTVITPTVGRPELDKLIDSIRNKQTISTDDVYHLIMWDDRIDDPEKDPQSYNSENTFSVQIPGSLGKVFGSHLRAVALMMVQTPWVTFSDDDVWWEPNHYATLTNIMDDPNGNDWGGVRRNIWNPFTKERIGVDNFESVGDSPDRNVPYEMLDGNCMVFKADYGFYGSPLYREMNGYGDDRKLYAYLKECNVNYKLLNTPTINQICPEKLVNMFETHCTK